MFEYAQTMVVNEKIIVSITDVCLVNLYSKQIRKKIATDNADKNGP